MILRLLFTLLVSGLVAGCAFRAYVPIVTMVERCTLRAGPEECAVNTQGRYCKDGVSPQICWQEQQTIYIGVR